jgi:hypothetical protein
VAHVSEAGDRLVPRLRNYGVGGFEEDANGTVFDPPQGFKGYHVECMVREVVLALINVPESGSVAKGVRSGTQVRSGE